jgi:hypothetical protein
MSAFSTVEINCTNCKGLNLFHNQGIQDISVISLIRSTITTARHPAPTTCHLARTHQDHLFEMPLQSSKQFIRINSQSLVCRFLVPGSLTSQREASNRSESNPHHEHQRTWGKTEFFRFPCPNLSSQLNRERHIIPFSFKVVGISPFK